MRSQEGVGGEHAVARFGGRARFRNDDDEEGFEMLDCRERLFDALWVGVIEEMDAHGVVWGRECRGNPLGAKGGTADADDEEVGVFFAVGGAEVARVDAFGEFFDVFADFFDFAADFSIGGDARVAEPVMTDSAVFVGIGDGAGFELCHFVEGARELRRHRGEEIIVEFHSTDIERKIDIFADTEIFSIAIEQFDRHF